MTNHPATGYTIAILGTAGLLAGQGNWFPIPCATVAIVGCILIAIDIYHADLT